MKISCPGCGRTYELPREVIDRIRKESGPKPDERDPEFFQQVTQAAARPSAAAMMPARSISRQPPRSRLKVAMLVVTILWPVAVVLTAIVVYQSALADTIPTGVDHIVDVKSGAIGTKGSLLGGIFLGSLLMWTVAWTLAMGFLGAIRYATRR